MPTAAITERSVGAAAFGQAGAVVASGAGKLSDTAAVDRMMFFSCLPVRQGISPSASRQYGMGQKPAATRPRSPNRGKVLAQQCHVAGGRRWPSQTPRRPKLTLDSPIASTCASSSDWVCLTESRSLGKTRIAYRASVQLSHNPSTQVLEGRPSRSLGQGRPFASIPLRVNRAPSAGTSTVHIP